MSRPCAVAGVDVRPMRPPFTRTCLPNGTAHVARWRPPPQMVFQQIGTVGTHPRGRRRRRPASGRVGHQRGRDHQAAQHQRAGAEAAEGREVVHGSAVFVHGAPTRPEATGPAVVRLASEEITTERAGDTLPRWPVPHLPNTTAPSPLPCCNTRTLPVLGSFMTISLIKLRETRSTTTKRLSERITGAYFHKLRLSAHSRKFTTEFPKNLCTR